MSESDRSQKFLVRSRGHILDPLPDLFLPVTSAFRCDVPDEVLNGARVRLVEVPLDDSGDLSCEWGMEGVLPETPPCFVVEVSKANPIPRRSRPAWHYGSVARRFSHVKDRFFLAAHEDTERKLLPGCRNVVDAVDVVRFTRQLILMGLGRIPLDRFDDWEDEVQTRLEDANEPPE